MQEITEIKAKGNKWSRDSRFIG